MPATRAARLGVVKRVSATTARQPSRASAARVRTVAPVDHQRVEEGPIAARDADRRRLVSEAAEQAGERAVDGTPADERGDRRGRTAALRERRAYAGQREDGADAHERIARCDDDRVGVAHRREHARRGARGGSAAISERADGRARALGDEIVLEREMPRAGVRTDVRTRWSLMGRTRVATPNARQSSAVTVLNGAPVAKPIGPKDVGREVAIAEAKPPGVRVEPPELRKATESVAAPAPAARLRGHARRAYR